MTQFNKEDLLQEIDNKTNAMLKLGKQLVAITPKLESFDILLISIVNRTVNLNTAFTSLMRSNNFIAGAPLVRINLDSLLRMYASLISPYDRNTFAEKVISGEQIRKMKLGNTNKSLHDVTLVDELSKIEGMDWVKKIYDAGNSYIHFCEAIIFSSQIVQSEEEQTVMQTIGIHDSFVSDSEKIGAIIWMNKIVDSIIEQCQIWMYDKCQRYNFDIEELNKVY
jgi:hypothetical protein